MSILVLLLCAALVDLRPEALAFPRGELAGQRLVERTFAVADAAPLDAQRAAQVIERMQDGLECLRVDEALEELVRSGYDVGWHAEQSERMDEPRGLNAAHQLHVN